MLSAGVTVQLVLLLWSVPLRAQSGTDLSKAPSSGVIGASGPDWNSLIDAPQPDQHVLAADHAPGDVHGVVRYPGGLPMAGAQVVILNADVDVERSTVSATDGTYMFKRLKPGHYQIGAKIDGFAPSRNLTVDVSPGKDVGFDVPVGARLAGGVAPQASASAYRSYGGAYRAEPASMHVSDSEPTAATEAQPAPAEASSSTAATRGVKLSRKPEQS
jgi:hypothetical protein